MPNEFWAAIAGALVGAVVGGIITYCIQKLALRDADLQRAEKELKRKKALGHALIFKVSRIHSHFYRFHRHMEEPFEKNPLPGASPEPWQVVQALANSFGEVHFTPDEMTMLLDLKNNDLFNDVVQLDDIHNSAIGLFERFSALRSSLLSQLPATMIGNVGMVALPPEQTKLVRPKMVELNELILKMKQESKRNVDEAWSALTRLNSSLNEKLGLGLTIELKKEGTPQSN